MDAAARRAARAHWPVRVTTSDADEPPTLLDASLDTVLAAVEEISLAAYALAGRHPRAAGRAHRAGMPTRVYRRGELRPSSEEPDELTDGLERRLS